MLVLTLGPSASGLAEIQPAWSQSPAVPVATSRRVAFERSRCIASADAASTWLARDHIQTRLVAFGSKLFLSSVAMLLGGLVYYLS